VVVFVSRSRGEEGVGTRESVIRGFAGIEARPSVRPCGAVGNLLPWCTNTVYYDAAATATHRGRSS
jgi:hypothetical protein